MATHNKTASHYLELLNHIASGKRRAGVFLQAWADTTPDLRTQQWCLGLGVSGPSEGAARTRALRPEEGAAQER